MIPLIVYLGVDVSKSSLDCHLLSLAFSVPNTLAGVRQLLKRIASESAIIHVICEATGGYESLVVEALHKAQVMLSVVNPRLPRDFARAGNRLAKTDRLDAAVLAAYGAAMKPMLTLPPDPITQRLAHLVRRREALVAERAAHKTRLHQSQDTWLVAQTKRMLDFYNKEVAKLEDLMEELIEQQQELKTKTSRLKEAAGIGWLGALSLCVHMPELGTLNKREATALAGLAPFNRDSGQWRGQRHITGGRGQVRRILYMASLNAIRRNEIFKNVFQRLKQAGKAGKVALTAVSRKLLILLNSALKNPHISLA